MIEDILEDYKKITEEIILNIKGDIDIINLMDKRKELLEILFENKKLNICDIKRLYLSQGLLDLDRKLELSIHKEQVKVKEEIKNLHLRKNANNAYEKNSTMNNFFNAKI